VVTTSVPGGRSADPREGGRSARRRGPSRVPNLHARGDLAGDEPMLGEPSRTTVIATPGARGRESRPIRATAGSGVGDRRIACRTLSVDDQARDTVEDAAIVRHGSGSPRAAAWPAAAWPAAVRPAAATWPVVATPPCGCSADHALWPLVRSIPFMLLLVDLDGVVYRGAAPVPGVAAVLAARAAAGDDRLTSPTTRCGYRADYVARLSSMGGSGLARPDRSSAARPLSTWPNSRPGRLRAGCRRRRARPTSCATSDRSHAFAEAAERWTANAGRRGGDSWRRYRRRRP